MAKALLSLVVAIAFVLAGAEESRAVTPTANAFVFVGGPGDIFESNTAGTRSDRLGLAGFVDGFALSPDGRRVALATLTLGYDGPKEELELVARRPGAPVKTLATARFNISSPSWSADGTRLAYEADGRLGVMTIASGKNRFLTKNDAGFAWAPSGHTIAFSVMAGIVVFDTDTGRRRLLPGTENSAQLSWLPDGRTLAFVDIKDTKAYTLKLSLTDGKSAPRRLVHATDYTLSPDGRTVAFEDSFEASTKLYVMPLTGGRPRVLYRAVADYVWAPDSSRIGFVRESGKTTGQLMTAGRDGGHIRALGSSRDRPADLIWSPDGTRIAYEDSILDGQWRPRVIDVATRRVEQPLSDSPEAVVGGAPIAWLPKPVTLPPTEKATVLKPDASYTANEPLASLAVDGTQMVSFGEYETDLTYLDWHAILWNPVTGAHAEPDLACHVDPEDLTIAGDRFAYVCDNDDPEQGYDIYVATLGNTSAPEPTFSPTCCLSVSIAGSGSLLVAIEGKQIVRLNPDGTQTILRTFPTDIDRIGVNSGRILVGFGLSELDVLDGQDGQLVATLSSPNRDGVALNGDRVITFDAGTVSVLSLDGHQLARWQVPTSAGLEDVHGSVAIFESYSRQYLLDLDTGHYVPISLHRQFSRAWMRFAADGSAFAAYNAPGLKSYRIDWFKAATITAALG